MDQINRSNILEGYIVVTVRQIWVSKRTHPYRSVKTKIAYSRGSPEMPMNQLNNQLIQMATENISVWDLPRTSVTVYSSATLSYLLTYR